MCLTKIINPEVKYVLFQVEVQNVSAKIDTISKPKTEIPMISEESPVTFLPELNLDVKKAPN
jgi:hypothetical protein